MTSHFHLLSRWPAVVAAGVAIVTATTISSRAGGGVATFAAVVFASWIGWVALAACTAVAEALRATPPVAPTLRTSLVAANDNVEYAVVVRLRR